MCECKLFFLGALVVCNVILVTSFNIDQLNYAVYRKDVTSMFGFTVAMHKDGGNNGWVLVGAPEAQSGYQNPNVVVKGGAVYQCSIQGDDSCREIKFDKRDNDVGRSLDEKSHQWFGATLSSSGQRDGRVVACAPRYIWFTKDLNRRDPVGTCFVSDGAFEHIEEYSPCRTMNWGYHRQGSCQAGFSAAINRVGDRLYVGAPGSYYWQGQMYSIDAHANFSFVPSFFGNLGYGAKGSVHQQSLENRPAVFSTREGKPPDDDSYMGYSTVVGHFKEGEQYEGIAVGMPRGNGLKGKVLLFTWNLKNYKNLTISQQIGAYFGYSLTAADVNGDKLLDLIVGAPMHTEPNNEKKYDVGRVYVFYQSDNFQESFDTPQFIDGFNSKSRFGHAVSTVGDLNLDGYDDFAIGAPYDGPNGQGAVYIYYGSQKGIREKYGQVIYAESIQPTLRTFGFSLTGGMDLDENEYPDMAIGAYLSDSAFFFRSRPVVLVDAFVRFRTTNKEIDIKNKNCKLPNGKDGTCTAIDFCIKYSGKGIPQRLNLTVQYILDSRKPETPRMAFFRYNTHTFNNTFYLTKDNTDDCKTEQIYIRNDIRDKLTPLEAEVKYFIAEDSRFYARTRNPRSELRPVIDLNSPPSRKDSISVQKNCGPDNICIPNLKVDVTSNVAQRYLLGSKKNLEFDVVVSNFGEDSFETTFEMKYPEGIHYRKYETERDMPGILCSSLENKSLIVCDIGNPLPQGKIALFKILFQPYYKEGMAASYEFDVLVNSTNPELVSTREDNRKHISISIWIDASLALRGDSYPPTAYYNESLYTSNEIVRESEIGPQITHVYYLTNVGPATIDEAEVFILWPLNTLGDEDLLYLLDQPYTQGNVKCDPTVSNYKHYNLDSHSMSIWDRLKIDTSGVQKTTTGTLSRGKNVEIGAGVSSGPGVVNTNESAHNYFNTTGDASNVYEYRHNVVFDNNGSVISSSYHGRVTGAHAGSNDISNSESANEIGRLTTASSREQENRIKQEREREERIRLQQEKRIQEEEWRAKQEKIRYQENKKVAQTNPIRVNSQDNRGDREILRQQAEKRKQDAWIAYQEAIRAENVFLQENPRPPQESREYTYLRLQVERRKQETLAAYHEAVNSERRLDQEHTRPVHERPFYEEHAYQVGGGLREGGVEGQYGQDQYSLQAQTYGSQTNNQGDYQDTRQYGVYRDTPRNPSGQVIYNRTFTVESTSIIPIDISGSQNSQHGLGEIPLGGGFTAQTLDLGYGSNNAYGQSGGSYGSESAGGYNQEIYDQGASRSHQGASNGGNFRREWRIEGSSSESGTIPPTIIHNRIEGDNVPTDRPNLHNRHRGKRASTADAYAEIEALVKCTSTKCNYIRCTVGALDKDKEIAIALRSRLNIRAIKNLTSNQPIKLSSMMVGRISKLPYVGKPKDEIPTKHEIFTEIPAKEPELVPEVAPLWIYVVSAVAGVVMLLLLIWLLSKCGFFKRNRPSSAPERQPLNRNGYHSGDEAL